MPTALGGKGKLLTYCFLVRCAYSQVTRSQHSLRAKGNLEDMTQSWPSQEALGGDQAPRIIYSSKEKLRSTQQRQSRGDVPQRMARHPRLAPHKSMLADDLKLSSDDDDTQRGNLEPASWDATQRSLSAQRGYTHGRRVRHSSSDSSGSGCSAESCSSSSLRSPSPSQSPENHRDPPSPVNTQPALNDKETDHPTVAQWQLDKWLNKSQKKSATSEHYPYQGIPGHSAHNQRSPSPARSWDSKQEYSPSQSPIPSPQFHYSHSSSLRSPGYSHCPSPSPFPSTCPGSSPSLSPRHSPIPSPVPSVCPSPHGSQITSRSPSPIPKDHPETTCPSLRAPSRVHHHPQVQSHNPTHPKLTAKPHSRQAGSWIAPLPNINAESNPVNTNNNKQSSNQHRPKSRLIQNQDQSQSKFKLSVDLNSKQAHRKKSQPKTNLQPSSQQVSEAPKSKPTPHCEQIRSGRSIHNNSQNKNRLLFQSSSHHSPTRGQHVPPTSHATNIGPRPHSLSPSVTAKSLAFTAPTTVHVSHTQTTQKKLQSKHQVVEDRGNHRNPAEGRKEERKQNRHRENQGKRERKEERRLAEEQLLRHPWNQSSAEEEEEVDGVTETQRKNEETARRENSRRREQQHRREWQTEQAKQRLPTNTLQHRHQEDSHHQGRTKKRGRSKRERELQPELLPRLPHSPSRRRPSFSSSTSSSSSNTESESEYQAPITKVPADSTSHKAISKREQQGTSTLEANRPKGAHPRGPTSGNTNKEQQIEHRQKLYTLVPFGRGEKASVSSQRGLRNLVVQIDLCLLKRVPDSTTSTTARKPTSSSIKGKQRDAMKHLCVPESMTKDGQKKRKMENVASHRENKRSTPYTNDLSGCIESETTHKGYLDEYLDSKRPLSPLSPLSDSPPESIKPPSKSKTSEQHHVQIHKIRHKNKDPAIKPKTEIDCVKVSRQPQPPSGSWGPARHGDAVPNHEAPHHAEYYLHEAKRMKHRADAMVDKLGKAVNYIDAALSFMECGKAMEEGPLEAKSPFTMYSETVELIRYAMKLKSHSGPAARQEDKQLAVLCFRCLALLYWQMFRLKKDHALKYSKVLMDYFKSSPRVPPTPPCWKDSGKNAGTGGAPSSLTPNSKHLKQGSHGGNNLSSFISIPQRIHQMAANHLNITNSVLYSYEYWEVADNLAKENKEFFNYLNTLSGPLTLHSSIAHAVQYTRQALQWIRISAKLN
ncbi:AF4/FMR2 family member 3 [Brachionichthys hirsutus]|uniref:AF4/FMR2 family member 3 n=1 Tax=Brachionichthys hirsutus TaxID=412623 RepID=UPI0036053127